MKGDFFFWINFYTDHVSSVIVHVRNISLLLLVLDWSSKFLKNSQNILY